MQKAYRHGDLALVVIDKIPEGLIPSDTKILMTGSGGNHHTFGEGTFYPMQEDDFVVGYLDTTQGTILYHIDHGDHGEEISGAMKKAILPPSRYECRKQQEYTNEGMRPVID